MQLKRSAAFAVLVAVSAVSGAGRAETPEQWIEIPAGIRIGLDALERLKAERRGVTVTFYSGEKAPCPCIADGVMLATQASPGQGTLQVAAEKAPPGLLAVVVIRDRKTGAGLRYSVADTWVAKIVDWNRTLDPAGRYQAAMSAPGLLEVADAP
jgi:hypothetical protein